MNDQLKEILEQLKSEQDEDRYAHTIGVMYTSAALAMKYGYPLEKAMLAGALHDCAKCTSNVNKLLLCRQKGIIVTPTEESSPFLLHSKLGVIFSREKFGICDEEILHAILVHTTGCPNMNLLDKIIYVADYIEPNRSRAHNLDKIRKSAFKNLDDSLRMILFDTLEYLKEKNFMIDPITEQTYQFYYQGGRK